MLPFMCLLFVLLWIGLLEIFRLLWPDTLSPHKTVDGSPIRATQLFERFLCSWRFTFGGQHHAPVRRGEADCSVLGPQARGTQ